MSIINSVKFEIKKIKNCKIRKKLTKESLKTLEKTSNQKTHLFFCGVPIHFNMGDQAQKTCIREWCVANYPDLEILELPTWPFYNNHFRKTLKECCHENDIFVIQSGYCTTSRHYDHGMHLFIAQTFPNNCIVIMPQTVRFTNEKDGYKAGVIYDKCKDLIFLARDRVSYESAKLYFPNTNVKLFPDIVTTLIGSWKKKGHGNGVLLCIRNDGERETSEMEIENLQNSLKNIGYECDRTDTNYVPGEDFIEQLEKMLDFFADHELVITDRYHGTIFSLIANTPVIVLETKDHKVKTGTEWFDGIYDKSFYNAETVEEAFGLSQKILSEHLNIENKPYFKMHYYDHLKEMIEEAENE